MLKLLAFLWSGCWHKWERVGGRIEIYDESRPSMPTGEKFRYRCGRCGIIKAFRA